jgi:hypothetical protein
MRRIPRAGDSTDGDGAISGSMTQPLWAVDAEWGEVEARRPLASDRNSNGDETGGSVVFEFADE